MVFYEIVAMPGENPRGSQDGIGAACGFDSFLSHQFGAAIGIQRAGFIIRQERGFSLT